MGREQRSVSGARSLGQQARIHALVVLGRKGENSGRVASDRAARVRQEVERPRTRLPGQTDTLPGPAPHVLWEDRVFT